MDGNRDEKRRKSSATVKAERRKFFRFSRFFEAKIKDQKTFRFSLSPSLSYLACLSPTLTKCALICCGFGGNIEICMR